MIKVLEIITHGKYSDIIKLVDEIIKCPECKQVGFHEGTFNIKARPDNNFSITCYNCDCEFLIEVE